MIIEDDYTCPKCHGDGFVSMDVERADGREVEKQFTCGKCHGEGFYYELKEEDK
jgi:DnaJ-class molecular chaperone